LPNIFDQTGEMMSMEVNIRNLVTVLFLDIDPVGLSFSFDKFNLIIYKLKTINYKQLI